MPGRSESGSKSGSELNEEESGSESGSEDSNEETQEQYIAGVKTFMDLKQRTNVNETWATATGITFGNLVRFFKEPDFPVDPLTGLLRGVWAKCLMSATIFEHERDGWMDVKFPADAFPHGPAGDVVEALEKEMAVLYADDLTAIRLIMKAAGRLETKIHQETQWEMKVWRNTEQKHSVRLDIDLNMLNNIDNVQQSFNMSLSLRTKWLMTAMEKLTLAVDPTAPVLWQPPDMDFPTVLEWVAEPEQAFSFAHEDGHNHSTEFVGSKKTHSKGNFPSLTLICGAFHLTHRLSKCL
eukprot:SAG11_NODE_656_length_7905_cov_4.191007_1_plen_295_part_00